MYTHSMRTTIQLWGNSLAIRIPKPLAMDTGLIAGKAVDISAKADGLRITPVEDLDTLLQRITPENMHGEISSGPPQGREIW